MDNYVYISVKLNLEEGQTHETIQEIVQEMDYSFDHSQIIDHEIIDILDTQIEPHGSELSKVDLFDTQGYSAMEED
jgi:hydrogenase maturation factor|tara:strand:+ start:321 stop:548 length:228 start_codon:yes stop_codon:yes gene_type:complete